MIESGSLTPGVDVAAFGLPPHTAVRFERPVRALVPFVSSYHVFESERACHEGAQPWLLPGWPAIRFILAPDPVALRIDSCRYDPMPVASLFGTAGKAMRTTTHGGVTVGIDLTPLGWARFFTQRADRYRDRVTPLAELLPAAWVNMALERLRRSDRAREVAPILDDMLLRILPQPGRDEPLVAALQRVIADDDTWDLGTASAATGLPAAALRRLSTRHFGFPPKTLLIRTRFMRSLLRLMMADDDADYSVMASSYFDASHFLRDAHRFLGMTPRRFMQQDHRYLIACLRARREVMRASRPAPASRVGASANLMSTAAR